MPHRTISVMAGGLAVRCWWSGRVLPPAVYRRLTEALPSTDYFPAYRLGECA